MAARFLVARPGDNVAVALADLQAGEDAAGLRLRQAIPSGHKFALREIAAGAPALKLAHPIGEAAIAIAAGEHVHTHNLTCVARAPSAASPVAAAAAPAPPLRAEFMGYRRDDGRVGTRNYIGILTSVNCSATVSRRIAAHFTPERLAPFANIDGVVALTHASGCGMAKSGRGIDNLRRTIAGYATHPNFAATLIVSLGCEVNQLDPLFAATGLAPSSRLRTLGIQESGGTADAIRAGIAIIESLLEAANTARRAPVLASEIIVGLQCGGSDGFSALTANPALGAASDLLVTAGGRIILSETPEIYGAEELLLRRAATPAIAHALIERLDWWREHAAREGASLDNNPSPGNIAGGITTILEKSLGAVAKAGASPLNDVVDYAARVTAPGFTFMDTPGYDPCSATGQIAGGANLIAFTTGRGAVFGSVPTPTLKLASNAELARRMADDIDLDCSNILLGQTIKDMGADIFAAMLAAASGRKTKSEEQGFGESEWVPWTPGAMY